MTTSDARNAEKILRAFEKEGRKIAGVRLYANGEIEVMFANDAETPANAPGLVNMGNK